MAKRTRILTLTSLCVAMALLVPTAFAQHGAARASAASVTNSNPFTCSAPEVVTSGPGSVITDATPGKKDFAYGATAMHKRDYRHAVYMFKLAAFYADAPAEYDLGLMYFRGDGVPVDKPLGAAWMVLAAERGNSFYVKARDLLVSALSDAEFARMNEVWAGLKKKYGEDVALPRAEHHWQRVLHDSNPCGLGSWDCAGGFGTATVGPLGGLQIVAGSAAAESLNLQGIWRIKNPYDYHGYNQTYPEGTTPCPSGTVRVEPLEQVSMSEGGAVMAPPGSAGSAMPSHNP